MSSLGLHLLHSVCPLTWLFNSSALKFSTPRLFSSLKQQQQQQQTHFTNEDIEAPEG